MSQELVALLAGAALAIAALAYVLQPLFTPERPSTSAAPAPPDDDIDARVRALRARHPACGNCGVRPEADAIYCSSCGRALEPS